MWSAETPSKASAQSAALEQETPHHVRRQRAGKRSWSHSAGEDEGRIGREVRKHLAQSLLVRPFRLLRRGQGLPGVMIRHGHEVKATGCDVRIVTTARWVRHRADKRVTRLHSAGRAR
ncbi:hypothetical protein GCM10020229_06020 [Kitasatospora albolonga]